MTLLRSRPRSLPIPSLCLLALAAGGLAGQTFSFGSQQTYFGRQYGIGRMAVGDFHRDGVPDVASGGSDVRIMLGSGDGKLIAAEILSMPAGKTLDDILAGDMNGDGHLDLVVNYRPNGFSVFTGDGSGKFPKRLDEQLPNSGYNALADLNGDGHQDLIYSTFSSNRAGTLGVFLGNGNGTFSRRLEIRIPEVIQSHPEVFDVDKDGKLDVVANSEEGNLSIFLGSGDGNLRLSSTIAVGRVTASAEFSTGDFNADGIVDLAVARGTNSVPAKVVGVLLGTGAGGFRPVVNYAVSPDDRAVGPACLSIGDLNGDGNIDIVVTLDDSGGSHPLPLRERTLFVLIGKGDGSFIPVRTQVDTSLPAFERQLALADLNRDGKLDIVFCWSLASSPDRSGFGLYTNLTPSRQIYEIVNAASYASGAAAPGEMVIIYGRNIGPATPASIEIQADGTAPSVLSGSQILFNGRPAPLYFASKDSVYAFVPYSLPPGVPARVEAVIDGEKTLPYSLPITASAPGLFTADSSGKGQAVIVNLADSSVNSPSRPAKKGSVVTLYLTGEGQTSPAGIDGRVLAAPPLPLPVLPVVVGMNNAGAEIMYAGGAGGLVAGIMQINVRIPEDAVSGPAIPIVVKVGEKFSQPGVRWRLIERDGRSRNEKGAATLILIDICPLPRLYIV